MSLYADQFNDSLAQVAQLATTTAYALETFPKVDEQQLYAFLRRNVTVNPLVYGSAIAFTPYSFSPRKRLFCPYIYRQGGTWRQKDTGTIYDYTQPQWNWYTEPIQSGQPRWSDPYFDRGAGDSWMVTYSVPFRRQGQIRGVATVDVALESLQQTMNIQALQEGQFFVLDRKGRIIFHNDVQFIGQSIFYIAKENNHGDLAALGRAMVAGQRGQQWVTDWLSQERQWVFYAPIPEARWSLAIRINEDTLLDFIHEETWAGLWILGMSFGLISLLTWGVTGYIVRPLKRLNAAAHKIAVGDLDIAAEVDTATQDELGNLGRTFVDMAGQLEESFSELHRFNQRLEEEVAHRTAALEAANRQLTEKERVLHDHNVALVQLSQSPHVQQGHFRMALQEIIQVTATTLRVQRASAWELQGDRLKCVVQYDPAANNPTQSTYLTQPPYPEYLKLLRTGNPSWSMIYSRIRAPTNCGTMPNFSGCILGLMRRSSSMVNYWG